ncbi:CP family cyanate transporter-like MFS transporter [Halopolyspora algeriensis]|uniref:CP family cyanate transporter-like MFS transporter n=1 Tax=Halopolyspora algeriensis TaxID=1500506 RepID=A0A368VFG8_9ACTN|nr:MFS transporter [Halopolyspora algeriensis]RCW39812.1 CP family cyanate transporter-like MFS transporter [Halopolyspora algeriensis]TQM56467.1 CP family cyanate transporter-like MFS transporter [Halopolyspora algeriensis]
MSSESCTQPASDHVVDRDTATGVADTRCEVPARSEKGAKGTAAAGGGLLLVGVALAAANMRPAVTSLATLLGGVQDSLGASTTWASVITSVPTLCFGLAGIGAPLLARRWGNTRIVGVSLAVLTVAMLLRVAAGPWTVLGGTVLVCAAIAMCNVLIPVVVKEFFPARVGLATGVYTTAMAAGGSAGSAFTPWLRSGLGSWQFALEIWAVLALAAFLVWVPATRKQRSPVQTAPTSASGPGRSLARSPLAWAVTAYFAMQSLVAYVVMGWLPEVFKAAGMAAGQAGALLGLLLLIGVPISMVLPPLVTRTRSQSWWALGLALIAIAGFLGLLLAPMAAPVVWALLIGTGMSAFPLALTFISLRTSNAADTGRLSAMSQSIGYLIASAGPFLFGMLHTLTAGWAASLTVVLVILALQGTVGIIAGRPRTV